MAKHWSFALNQPTILKAFVCCCFQFHSQNPQFWTLDFFQSVWDHEPGKIAWKRRFYFYCARIQSVSLLLNKLANSKTVDWAKHWSFAFDIKARCIKETKLLDNFHLFINLFVHKIYKRPAMKFAIALSLVFVCFFVNFSLSKLTTNCPSALFRHSSSWCQLIIQQINQEFHQMALFRVIVYLHFKLKANVKVST